MFESDRFIADCRAAVEGGGGQPAVREILAQVLESPGAVLRALGEPQRAGLHTLHRSPDLTILNLVWGPWMTLRPHDHRMWAVIGIYTGREDNIFWKRTREAPGHIEAAGAKALSEKDAVPLGKDIIHSVTNPIPRLTGAIHVYGGDFFGAPRSEWDPERLAEGPYDVERTLKTFEESNRMFPRP
jgi:predicted metal-dependent enzyme (double-stranded beta helix superfamily)